MYHLDSDPETPPEWSHHLDGEEATFPGDNRLNSASFRGQENSASHHPDDAPDFRLTLSSLRDNLDDNHQTDELVDDGYTSQISTDSPRAETPPPDTPEDVHLIVDRNSIAISNRSSLDLRLAFSPDSDTRPSNASSDPPLDLEPHLSFLKKEIHSTRSSGEYFTHRMLVILWDYFAYDCVEDSNFATRKETARMAAENLHSLNEEYLLTVSSWEVLESDTQLQGFLWLVWTCLLEVVVRMDYAGDETEGAVVLVGEMLAGGSGTNDRKLEIKGKDGRIWTGNEIPTFSTIWESAYLGFGPAVTTSYPIEASPQEWIASYSFLGRLTAAGLADGWELEVWALDDALGETTWEDQGRLPTRTAECLVLAAAEFIRHAGERLAAAAARSPPGWVRTFAHAKWEHWMERFGEVADMFEDGGPGPVQWAAWFAREHMLVVGERAGF